MSVSEVPESRRFLPVAVIREFSCNSHIRDGSIKIGQVAKARKVIQPPYTHSLRLCCQLLEISQFCEVHPNYRHRLLWLDFNRCNFHSSHYDIWMRCHISQCMRPTYC